MYIKNRREFDMYFFPRGWYLHLKTQNLFLVGPALVALRFEWRDWRSVVQCPFHVELRNGLRELTAFAEH